MAQKPNRRAATARTAPPKRPARPAFTPAERRARHDGWAPAKQVAFIDALAASGNVAEACAAVGMSRTAAYQLRTNVGAQAFRLAWDAALDLAVRRIGDECFDRAMNGVPVPHFYKGEQVGEHRRYDNRLAMFILRYRDPLRYAATLDQMVYQGHVEVAAIAFARAQNRLHEEAWDVPTPPEPGDPEPGALPYEAVPVAQELEAAKEKALIEGTGIIGGSPERRRRITEQRQALVRERWAAERERDKAVMAKYRGTIFGTPEPEDGGG